MLEILVPMLGHAFRFATPENEWQQLFVQFLPEWLTVSDPSLLSGYYEGELPLYTAKTLLGWATPVLWWTAFITVLIFGMLCINIIVRKQWIEHEKLSYPIIQLPLQLTETPQTRLFQSKLMWVGFGIAGGLAFWNGINFLFPILPEFRTRIRSFQVFTESPWNANGQNSIFTVSICNRGLASFIPLDLSFSLLVFLLVLAVYACPRCCTGSTHPTSLSIHERASGWGLPRAVRFGNLGESPTSIARWPKPFVGLNTRQDNTVVSASGRETQEAMSYRGATIGLIAVMVFLVLFCYYGGAELWVMFAFFVIYYMISIAITRMRAELGTPVHDLHYSGPRRDI